MSNSEGEKPPSDGYTAIRSRLGYRSGLVAPDIFERAMAQLYPLYVFLGGKWPRNKALPAFVGSAAHEALADEWLRERESYWAARGRINRFGYLTVTEARPVTLPRLRRAFPQLSRTELLSLRAGTRGALPVQYPAPAPTGLPRYRGRLATLETL